jgi:hypothetical protein
MFLLRFKTAEIAREIVDTIPPMADEIPEQNYDVILGLDKKLQDLLNGLPTFCKLDAKSISETKAVLEGRSSTLLQRISVHLGIHARICRLHRPYHLEAYSNPEYSYSRIASVQSAYRILELRRMMDDADAKLNFRPERYLVIFLHTASAALTLAVDVSHNPEAPSAQAQRDKVSAAYETLNKSRKNAKVLIKGIEKSMEQAMGALQKQRQSTVSSIMTTSAKLESSVLDGVSTGMNDVAMDMPETYNWEEHSHRLWSDFLAVVPDLEEFEWTSLLQDVDFDPNYFS